MWYKGKNSLYGSVVNRLRPHPTRSVEVTLDDRALQQSSPLSDHMEELKIDGKTFISFKPNFVKELTMAMRRSLLARSQVKRQ